VNTIYQERQDLEEKIQQYAHNASIARRCVESCYYGICFSALASISSFYACEGWWKLVAIPFLLALKSDIQELIKHRADKKRYENRAKHYQTEIDSTWNGNL
jgi:hypothetical protein